MVEVEIKEDGRRVFYVNVEGMTGKEAETYLDIIRQEITSRSSGDTND